METQVQKIISSKTCPSERLEAYQFLIKFIQEEKDIPHKFLKDFNAVLNALKQDLKSGDVNLMLESLHLIGIFLRTEMIVNVIEENKLGEIIDDLYSLIMTSQDKMVSTRALWCLAKLKVPLILWIEKLDIIMEIIERPQPDDPKQISGSYELEIIRVLNRLLTEMPEQMTLRVPYWSRRLYLATVYPTLKVREPALIVLDTVWSLIQKQQTHQSLVVLIGDLKEKLVPGMSRMFKEKQEIQSLKLWRILLKLLGKALHQGASLINTLLGIVEKGFKSTNTEVKVEAFKSWHQLIVNFGSELEVLANPKRLRLVMQPLKANNARTEIVANTKFKVWWFLMIILGPKLVQNLEIVLHPFLQFCFGIEGSAQLNQLSNTTNNSSLHTPESLNKMSLSNCSSQSSSPVSSKFSVVHRLGCEALAQILGHKSDLLINRPNFTIDELPFNVLDIPQRFLHHSKILLFCVKRAIIGLGTEKRDLHLQLYLLHNAVSHIKINADGENKKEFSEALSLLLYTFEEFVVEESLSSDVILKLLEISTFIPKKVLHSSAYTIEEASVMSGTPSLFLIKLLFRNPLLHQSSTERFRSIFQKLISEDDDSTVDTLSFTELVVKTIDSAANEIDNSDTLISLWNIVATNLLDKIETTKEINQGDSLEHDFGCIYAVLLFPINHLYSKPLFQGLKTLDTTWSKLCRKFGSLKDFVPKVPVNIWCEEFSSKILNNIPDDLFKIMIMQENLSNLLKIIVRLVNFSSVDNIFLEGESKENWMKRKSKPLGHVSSFISLYNKLVSAVVDGEKELVDPSPANIQIICNAVVNLSNVAKVLFSKITFPQCLQPLLSHLMESVSNLFVIANKIKFFKTQHHKFLFNEMWNACVNAIKNSYEVVNSQEHCELFRIICPAMEATLYYSDTTIREKSLELWQSTFMLSPARLVLPESFKDVFRSFETSTVPGSGRQVLNAIQEVVCMSQKEDVSKRVTLATKDHPETQVETVTSEAKRRRLLTDDAKEVAVNTSPGITAQYSILSPDSYPLVPSPFIDAESYLKVESRNSEQNQIAQKQLVNITLPTKRVEEEQSVEVVATKSSNIESSMDVDVDVDSSISAIHSINLPTSDSDTSACVDGNVTIIEISPTKEGQNIDPTDKTEPECVTNGEKVVILVPDDDDDTIPSSQAPETVVTTSQLETKSKSADSLPLPKSTKEKSKRATKHRARRSMRFADALETTIVETGSTESSSDLEKASPVKKRRKSSHHVREESGNGLKPSQTKEKEVPVDKKRSKTARKSCPSTPVYVRKEKPYSGESSKSNKKSGNSEICAAVIQSSQLLRRCLNKSEKSELGFKDGVKPMEVDDENVLPLGAKFENLIKSPIADVQQSPMDTSSSDLSIFDEEPETSFNESPETETSASRWRNKRDKMEEPLRANDQTESEPKFVSDNTLDPITDREMQNTSPDINTIGSELTVASEVVVIVSSDEKENEMIVTETEVDEIKIGQHVAPLNEPLQETLAVPESKSESKTEQTARRSSKSSSDRVPREEGVQFSPQRYIKTYSKGTPVVEAQKNEAGLPLSAALMQRVGSRGLKILEAATKQNLSNYEKLKYENKKISPVKSPDRRSLDFFKSPSPDMSSTPTGTPERKKGLLKGSFSSPAGSPSIGILKKQLKRFEVPSTGSPSNKRRVSFADPLVQGLTEVQNKSEQKDVKKPVEVTAPHPTSNLCPSPKETPVVTSENMPILEKQVPFELEAEEAIENVIEALVVQPPQLEIAAVTEIESSVEEIGATAEVVSGIETVETLNENVEPKNEQFITLADEVLAVQMEVESNQREMRLLEQQAEQATCQSNTSPEVPEIEMEVLVPVNNQTTVKAEHIAEHIDEHTAEHVTEHIAELTTTEHTVEHAALHVVGQSGDAPDTLLSKSHVGFDWDLSQMLNYLNSKFTLEELKNSSISQMLSFQQQLLNMALTVTNALKRDRKEPGSNE